MRRIYTLLLFALLATAACADVARFDPPDPRLDKKVTVDVNHTKLEDVAKSLTEQSGVTIKAGSGERDWKVRETCVTVHAKDVAAGAALAEVSRLLGYYVSREGKQGEWSYIIWQDKKSRDLEAEMMTAQKEADAQRIKDGRQSAMDNAKKALGMTPEEAMKQKDKDPMMAFMGGTKTGRAFSTLMSSFGSQFPTEYDLMMRGKMAFMPLSGLPANLQGAVGDALNGGFAKAIQKEPGSSARPDLTPQQLVIMPMPDNQGNQMAGMMGMAGMMFITGLPPDGKSNGDPFGGGRPMTMFPIMSPNSPASNLFGEAMLGIENGESLQSVNERLGPKIQDGEFLAKMLAKDSPTEKEVPTDPELTREIEIKAEGLPKQPNQMSIAMGSDTEAQSKTLEEISRATEWPVYFESFGRMMPISMFVKPGKQPLCKILIAVEKAGYKWERGEKTLRIRPENWALRRSYAIPASYIRFYQDLLEKNGAFTIDDVAGIAGSLTDEQITNTFLTEPDFTFLMGALSGSQFNGARDLLRTYASLTQDQKQSLSMDDGLPFGQLTDAQWDRLNTIITDRLGGVYVADGSVRIKPLSEAEIKEEVLRRTFEVTVQVQGEKEPRKFDQMIWLQSKKDLATMREQRKAAEQKKAEQPAQPQQPAPAK